jgi:hypothetical protein
MAFWNRRKPIDIAAATDSAHRLKPTFLAALPSDPLVPAVRFRPLNLRLK